MKKIFLPLFLLLLITVSCNKKDESSVLVNDLKAFDLKGKVKSVKERSYEFVGGDAKGGLKRENAATYDFDLEFDDNSHLISEKIFLSTGKLFQSKTYEHKNKMLLDEEFLPNGVIYRTKYTWEGDKNIIISKRDKDGKQLYRTVNTLEKGNITQKRTFDQNDELTERFLYKYDAKGNVTEVSKFSKYDELLYKDAYGYDSKGNKNREARLDNLDRPAYKIVTKYQDSLLTETTNLDATGEVQYSEIRKYDAKGKLLKSSTNDIAFNEKVDNANEYDKNGNLTKWTQYVNDKLTQSIKYEYDSHNNQIKIERTDGNGNVLESKSFAFEYDDEGNWIRKSIIKGNIQTFVIERTIEYY